jgi:hypothetical protein
MIGETDREAAMAGSTDTSRRFAVGLLEATESSVPSMHRRGGRQRYLRGANFTCA